MVKNKIKILAMGLLSLVLFIGIFFVPHKTYAAAGSISVTASAGEIIAGNTITVTVKLSNPAGIAYSKFELTYDSNIFAYVSGADGSGYNGVIPFEVVGGGTEQTDYTWTITFKANQTGTCNFKTVGHQFIDTDVNVFSPTLGSASVKVWAVGSDDATLSNIQIGGATLSPAFAKWTLDYTCYVGNGVTSVTISAPSSQGGKVEIAGNYTNLAVGNNYITIKSHAPNGKVMTYKVNVFRLEPPTEPPTPAPTEPPTEPPADIAIKIDGVEYNVSSDYSQDIIPQGFYVDLDTYNGKDVMVAKNDDMGLTLMYLVDTDGNGEFYNYDGKNFYRYVVIKSINGSYIVYDSRKAGTGLEGTESDMMIGEQIIRGYQDVVNKDFVYFYGMNSAKEFGWYSYDLKDNSIQRMNVPTFEEPTVEEETTPDETAPQETTSQRETTSVVKQNKSNIFSFRNIFLVTTVCLLVIVMILSIYIGCSRKKTDSDETEDEAVEEELVNAEMAGTKETKQPTPEVAEEKLTEKEESVTEEEKMAFDAEAEKLAEHIREEVAKIEDEEAIEMLYVNKDKDK